MAARKPACTYLLRSPHDLVPSPPAGRQQGRGAHGGVGASDHNLSPADPVGATAGAAGAAPTVAAVAANNPGQGAICREESSLDEPLPGGVDEGRETGLQALIGVLRMGLRGPASFGKGWAGGWRGSVRKITTVVLLCADTAFWRKCMDWSQSEWTMRLNGFLPAHLPSLPIVLSCLPASVKT